MDNNDDLKIIIGENNNLRAQSRPVENFKDPNLKTLIKQMQKTLANKNGIGLAAPQVGKPLQLFIIEIDYDKYVMINPKIKHLSKDKISMEEGCLSFPNIYKNIKRSKKVTIHYFDENGEQKKIKAKGLLARAIQHEYDHLQGVIFLDRIKQ
ncbi:MAG: peptide deformylase [Candidatus Moranbacteria bacterium]|nr:peptide deformylase [Candidatus Moranbacteria bacterium]